MRADCCFYCVKRPVREGLCKGQHSVGRIEVCGRHLHCIVAETSTNIGQPRVAVRAEQAS